MRLRETTGRGRALAFRAGIESDRLAVYFFRLRPMDIWISAAMTNLVSAAALRDAEE